MKAEQVLAPIQNEISLVRENLKKVADVDFPQCAELFSYILNNMGKGLRPILTLLSGKFYSYNRDLLIPMATGVELLHIATLVHDDIVDNSSLRRGLLPPNKLWDSNSAMLAGDYLFAKAAEIVSTTENLRVIKLFAQTLMKVSQGELYETVSAYNPQRNRRDYFAIISAKTASLFVLAAESGAVLSGAPEEKIQALKSYAYNLGMAFQIRDDILDFVSSEEEMGKPVKKDLPQGNLTLPAILFLEQYPDSDFIKDALEKRDEESLQQAIATISNSAAIKKSWTIAANFAENARQKIALFPDNTPRQALIELAEYVIED